MIVLKTVQRRKTVRFWSILPTLCLVCVFAMVQDANRASAQFLDQGALTGTVLDATGAVIPGAKVTIENPETTFKLSTTADAAGVYNFSPIKIGSYTVTVTADGFETQVQKNIKISLGERVNFSPKLRPGSVNETVTVTTAPPLLQSQDSSIGTVLSTQEINQVPLNGRNTMYLIQLAAGAAPSRSGRGAHTGDFDANGMRAEQNNFVLDGVDNNAVSQDYLSQTSYSINPPPDALEEFQVSTANYSAEYGHSAGAVVNASIKSGTNEIHGDAWEYWRNDILDARNWDAAPGPNPEYRENEFGATLGLPILRNHLFFFGDAQANRVVIQQTQSAITVPTAAERTGDFSELLVPSNFGASKPQLLYQPGHNQNFLTCPGRASTAAVPYTSAPAGTATGGPGQNILCANQIDSVAQAILNMYPLPNTTAHGVAFDNYNYVLKQPDNTFQWDTRVDWNISPKDQAFARFSYLNQIGNFQAPLGPILDGGGGEGSTNVSGVQVDYGNNFVFSETHIFAPKVVNEFRFAFNFGHFDTLNPGFNTNDASALGLGGIPFGGASEGNNGGLPTTTISGTGGFFGFGAHAYRPEKEWADEYQVLDNVAWTLGNHSLRLGFSLQSIRSYTLEPPSSHPAYTFNGTMTSKPATANTGTGGADFLTDNMTNGSIGPSAPFNDAQDILSGYAQDDWKITRNLTLNLGLRYDHFQPYKEMAGLQANFYVTSVGVSTGTGVYLIPARDQGKITINPAFLTELAANNIALQYDSNDRLTNAQSMNFAPRIGFAITVDPKTVLRGGYGIFYQGQQEAGAADNIGTNYPFVFTDNFPAPGCIAGAAACQTNGYTLESGFAPALAAGLTNYFATPGLVGQSPTLKTTYATDYNLAVQRAITDDIVATISYVGNVARHLPAGENNNSTVALLPSGTTQKYLPFPSFAGSTNLIYGGISSYNGLQAELEKRLSHGLSFRGTYTWSHALTDAGDPLGGGVGNERDVNIIPIREEMTNNDFDTRQRFTFNGYYKLPFGRGESYLNNANRATDTLLGGWAMNLTYTIQSGNPFTVGAGANQTDDVGGSQNAILIANPFAAGGMPNSTNPSITCPTSVRNKAHWYNPCAFKNPLPASQITPFGKCPDPTVACNPTQWPFPTYVENEADAKLFLGSRSNQIAGPGFQRLDASVFKHFLTYKEQFLELRADAFNVLNTPSYGLPSTTSIGQTGGQITSHRNGQALTPDARFFQLSAKYVF